MTTVKPTRSSLIESYIKGIKTAEKAELAPPADDWLKLKLDEAVEGGYTFWDPPRETLRASALSNGCLRAITFEALGHRVPVNSRTRRVFRLGNLIEEAIVTELKRARLLAFEQVEVEHDTLPIAGHVDVIIERDEKLLCGEIKSINHFNFSKLPEEHGPVVAGKSPLMKKHESYVRQWNTYAGLTDIYEGFILFEEKDFGGQRVYWLLFDRRLYAEAMEKARQASGYLLTQTLAPVPANADPHNDKHKLCGGCSARYLCSKLAPEAVDLQVAITMDRELRG